MAAQNRTIWFASSIALLLAFLTCAVTVFMWELKRPQIIVWDFHKYGHGPSAVGFPHGIPGGMWELNRAIDLTVIDSAGNQIFHDNTVLGVNAMTNSGGFSAVAHFGFERNAEESYQIAKRLMIARQASAQDFSALEVWHSSLVDHADAQQFAARLGSHPTRNSYPSFRNGIGNLRIDVRDGTPILNGVYCRCSMTVTF